MKRCATFVRGLMGLCMIAVIGTPFSMALQSSIANHESVNQSATAGSSKRDDRAVPRLVKYAGVLKDGAGNARTGTVGMTFAVYGTQQGGAALWQETQNVQLDNQGRYNVLLGSTRSEGLPSEIFVTNEARWLGVQVLADAEAEQPRVVLVSVPYALKAQDAETLGGRPASAYLLSDSIKSLLTASATSQRLSGTQAARSLDISGTVSTVSGGTVDTIPKFSASDTLGDSLLTEAFNLSAIDAFGNTIPGQEDRIGVGLNSTTGRPTRLEINGRMVAKGFDITTSSVDSVHIVNSNPNGNAIEANASSQSGGYAFGLYATTESSNGGALVGFAYAPLVPMAGYSWAVLAGNENKEGAAVFGFSNYADSGDPIEYNPTITGPVGVFGSVRSTTGVAGIFDNRAPAGGKIFSGRANGVEKIAMTTTGNITASGTVAATSFSGSGAGLTGVNAATATNASTAVNFSGSLAGDVTGTQSATTVAKVRNVNVDPAAPADGQALIYNQSTTSWKPTTLATINPALSIRGINYVAGCDSCNLLQNTDSERTIYMNVVGGMTITQVTCFSDAGTPTINLQRDDGSPANILTSDLSCSSSGTSTSGIVGAESILNLNDKIDFIVVNAGGTAKRVTVVIKTVLN